MARIHTEGSKGPGLEGRDPKHVPPCGGTRLWSVIPQRSQSQDLTSDSLRPKAKSPRQALWSFWCFLSLDSLTSTLILSENQTSETNASSECELFISRLS